MTASSPPTPSPSRRLFALLRELAATLLLVAVVSTLVGRWRAPDLPEDAPTLRLEDLDGALVDLADLRGQTVVVNFWASWCAPCRAELPLLARTARQREDLTFLFVSTDEDAGVVRRIRDDLDLPGHVLLADARTQHRWGVSTLPTTVVVDAAGRIAAAHTGLLVPPQLSLMLP